MKKSQGKFTGGKRAFGYDVVDCVKVPRADEQRVIQRMIAKRAEGASYRSIETWLAESENVKLTFMGVRNVLSKVSTPAAVTCG